MVKGLFYTIECIEQTKIAKEHLITSIHFHHTVFFPCECTYVGVGIPLTYIEIYQCFFSQSVFGRTDFKRIQEQCSSVHLFRFEFVFIPRFLFFFCSLHLLQSRNILPSQNKLCRTVKAVCRNVCTSKANNYQFDVVRIFLWFSKFPFYGLARHSMSFGVPIQSTFLSIACRVLASIRCRK